MTTDPGRAIFPPFYSGIDSNDGSCGVRIDLNPPARWSAVVRRNCDLIRMGFGRIYVPTSPRVEYPSPPWARSPSRTTSTTESFGETEGSTVVMVETSVTSEADDPGDGETTSQKRSPARTLLEVPYHGSPHHAIDWKVDKKILDEKLAQAHKYGAQKHLENILDWQEKVYYTFRMSIGHRGKPRERPPGPPGFVSNIYDPSFSLIPDTGSNTTWVFGAGFYVIPMSETLAHIDAVDGGPSQDGSPPTGLSRRDLYHATGSSWRHHAELENCWRLYRVEGQSDNPASLAAVVGYENGSTASLVIGTEGEKGYGFYINKFNDETEISGTYKFAVAYCVDELLYHRPYDGVLGLGLARCQQAFTGSIEEDSAVKTMPSFLHHLMQHEALPRSSETLGEHATATYVSLHPKDGDEECQRSCISFNGFTPPKGGNPLKWVGPIQVTDYGIRNQKWVIRMVKMEVFDFELDAESGENRIKGGPRAMIDFSDAPIDAILDTSTSVSFVPSEIIRFIRTEVFDTPYNKQRQEELGDRGADLYDLTPDYKTRIDDARYNVARMAVVVHFDDLRGGSVSVTLPMDPFLFTKEREVFRGPKEYEGVLFAHPNPWPDKRTCILGINFLEASVVSLVNPSIEGRLPEVYIAARWRDAQEPIV